MSSTICGTFHLHFWSGGNNQILKDCFDVAFVTEAKDRGQMSPVPCSHSRLHITVLEHLETFSE